MSGLDKIIADIGESAQNQYNDIIAAAEKEADALLKSEKTAADSDAESYVNRAKERIKTAENAEEASNEMLLRQGILKAKLSIIDETREKAVNEILVLDEKEYFAALKKVILGNYLKASSGLLRLNEADRKRLPADFLNTLNKELSNGASLKLDEKTANIRGGCILVYGDIEENCSFDAIAASLKDTLRDETYKILFS